MYTGYSYAPHLSTEYTPKTTLVHKRKACAVAASELVETETLAKKQKRICGTPGCTLPDNHMVAGP